MAAAATAAVTAMECPRYVEETDRIPENYLALNPEFPGVRQISKMPPVYTVDGFLTPEECEKIKMIGMSGLKRSIVVDGTEGKTSAPTRTSQSTFLRKTDTVWLAEKVARLTGKPEATQEPAQLCQYTDGQKYASHYDAFDLTNEPGRACARTGGQRVATVLVYLNTITDGAGGTDFPKLGISVAPKQGTALVFFPCTLDGKLDTQALHSGMPVTSEKWVCQVWIRQSNFC